MVFEQKSGNISFQKINAGGKVYTKSGGQKTSSSEVVVVVDHVGAARIETIQGRGFRRYNQWDCLALVYFLVVEILENVWGQQLDGAAIERDGIQKEEHIGRIK